MPIQLLSEDERLIWKHEESESGLYYRRPSLQLQEEIRARHTKKGVTDNAAVARDILDWSILGWFGINDENRKEVEFSREKIGRLPETYKVAFIEGLYSLSTENAELGN